MRRGIIRFAANDDGAAALEYSLIVAGIALAFIAVFFPFAQQLQEIAETIRAGIADIVALTNL